MTASSRILRPVLILALLLLPACGGGDSSSDSGQASDEAAADAAAESTPMGTASVTGSVMFEGTPPDMPRIRLDPECQELHDGPVTARTVVVGEEGGLANVFVRVSDGLGEYSYAPPSEPVVLDQNGCMYHPHVLGVQAGQDIRILNSDPFLHNINAQPSENRGFNFGMPNQGDERARSFRVEEVSVPIKCDVHPWMNAYAAVVDHPYFAVTGEDGSFTIDQLPAGTYTIEAWHEQYGTSTQTVTVEDGGSASARFTFNADSAS